MRRCRYLAAPAHTSPSEGPGVLPRRRPHTSRTIASTDDCLPGSRSKSVCVTFPPLMAVGPELQMSLTTLSWFGISLEAASICPSTFCIATAARRLMSGARPGMSSMDPWMRPERNVAASTHTNASAGVDGPDTSWPSRRLQTAFSISSTDSLCLGSTRFRFFCVSVFPSIFFGPGLVMSWTTLVQLDASLWAASSRPSVVLNACAAAVLMSALRYWWGNSHSSDGPWMRLLKKLAASAHASTSSFASGSDSAFTDAILELFPRRRSHTSRSIASTAAACLGSSLFRWVCESTPPFTPRGPGLVMSLTTVSRFHVSLEAASMCPSTVRIAVAEAKLMSGSRPGISVFDPWTRAPLAVSIKHEATNTTQGLCSQELDLRIWLIRLHEACWMHLDPFQINRLGTDRLTHLNTISGAVLTIRGWQVHEIRPMLRQQ